MGRNSATPTREMTAPTAAGSLGLNRSASRPPIWDVMAMASGKNRSVSPVRSGPSPWNPSRKNGRMNPSAVPTMAKVMIPAAGDAEVPAPHQGKRHQRVRGPTLDHQQSSEGSRRGDEHQDLRRPHPPVSGIEAQDHQHQGRGEEQGSRHVEALGHPTGVPGKQPVDQDQRHEPYRHVDVEDRWPTEETDQKSPEARPDHGPQRGDQADDRHGPAAFLRSEVHGGDGQDRGADRRPRRSPE